METVPRERTLAARLAFVAAYPHSNSKSLLPVVRAMYVPLETFTINLRAVTAPPDAASKPTTTAFKTKQPVSLSGAGWQPLDAAVRFTVEHGDAFTRAHDRAYHNVANVPYRTKLTAEKLAISLGDGCPVVYESSSGYPRWAGTLMACFERWVDDGIAPVGKKRGYSDDIASAATKQAKTARTAVPSEEMEYHAGNLASSYYGYYAPKKPVPKPAPKPAPKTVPEPEPGPSPTDLKRPAIPDLDVQEARILFRNSALLRHLRTHSDGDWVKNPQRKVAGKHTLPKTKDRKADSIKTVVRDWLLTTPQGKRALAAADVAEGELSIDRVLARHDKQHGMSLNCVYNLYLMPVRHNSYFGDTCSAEKRAYIGERAYKLAREAHDAFVRDREADYDWDAGFAKRALFIVST